MSTEYEEYLSNFELQYMMDSIGNQGDSAPKLHGSYRN